MTKIMNKDEILHKLSRVTTTKEHTKDNNINKTSYEYDNLNRVTQETQNDHIVKKVYDNNSNLLNVKVDNTLIQSNTYNEINNLVQISDSFNTIANISYDTDSKINEIEYGNGISTTIVTDKRDRETTREYKDPIMA